MGINTLRLGSARARRTAVSLPRPGRRSGMQDLIVSQADPNYDAARKTVRGFTIAAMAIGAAPVPAASAVIVAENTAMVAVIASHYGVQLSFSRVVSALGVMGGLNVLGRTLFVEVARVLCWGAGPLGIVPVRALGASTAGIQTWVLGHLAIALCRNDGAELQAAQVAGVVSDAKGAFNSERSALVAEALGRNRDKTAN